MSNMQPTNQELIADFNDWAKTRTNHYELGACLTEYLTETDWEGFSSRDLTGIRRFLVDFREYFQAKWP